MKHRNINFKKYFLILFLAMVSSGYSNAQTSDNSVNSSKIKVTETRKLETKILKPSAKDSTYIKRDAKYCEENGITRTRKFSYSYMVLILKRKKVTDMNGIIIKIIYLVLT